MKNFDLLDAIGGADDQFKQEVLNHMNNTTKGKYQRPSPARRLLRTLPVAAALICLLGVTAYAATHFFGLKEFHEKYEIPALPSEAVEIIETHTEEGTGDLVTYQLKEVLCDSQQMKVIIEVRAAQPGKYVLLPVDGGENFGLDFFGLEGEGTIGEYAEANGLTMLNINGGLKNSSNGASLWNECITPELQELIISCERASVAPGTEASCYIIASGKGVQTQRSELPFTFTDSSTSESAVYAPVKQPDMEDVLLGNITLTRTELGTYLELPVRVPKYQTLVDSGREFLNYRVVDGDKFYVSTPIQDNGDGMNFIMRIDAEQMKIGDSFMLELWDASEKTTYEQVEFQKIP